jgi:hypothetical protein
MPTYLACLVGVIRRFVSVVGRLYPMLDGKFFTLSKEAFTPCVSQSFASPPVFRVRAAYALRK